MALAGFSLGGITAASESVVANSVENSRVLDRQFKLAEADIERFRSSSGRLPNPEEFNALTATSGVARYQVELMPAGFALCDGESAAFRKIPPGTYVLAAWHGEWWECYAAPNGKSTLTFDPSGYAMFGNQVADGLVLAGVGMIAAIALWFRRLPWRRMAAPRKP